MSYREYKNRIEVLINLIEIENTGTAQELAVKLGISRRTVSEYLSDLKSEGYMIKYDRQRRTFYF